MGLHKPLFITYPTRNLCVVVLKAGDVRTYYIGFDLAPEPGPGKGASSTQDPPPLTQDDSLKRRLRGLRVEGKSGPFPTCLRHLPPPALRVLGSQFMSSSSQSFPPANSVSENASHGRQRHLRRTNIYCLPGWFLHPAPPSGSCPAV